MSGSPCDKASTTGALFTGKYFLNLIIFSNLKNSYSIMINITNN